MGSQGTSPPVINYPPSLLTPSPPDIIQSLEKKKSVFFFSLYHLISYTCPQDCIFLWCTQKISRKR